VFLLLVSEDGALGGEHLPAVRAGQPVQVPVHAATHNDFVSDPDKTRSADPDLHAKSGHRKAKGWEAKKEEWLVK